MSFGFFITRVDALEVVVEIKRRKRYDFFIIWGNGLDHTDEILDILRAESTLEILQIEKRHVENMQAFVFQLYACDTVPIEHLRAKLRYLHYVAPEIVLVFVRNLDPQEMPAGAGPFRKVQCQNINRIKWDIRERFNPRVDGRRSEEHVIHASDYEEQVDYCLKLLGYKGGIHYLVGDGAGLPFHKPHHIARPSAYTYRTVPMGILRASILQQHITGEVSAQSTPIAETPHFRALQDDPQYYIDYVSRFRYTRLKDNHRWERLLALSQLDTAALGNLAPILVQPLDGYLRILDGVHRAAVMLYRGFEALRCIEMIY